MIDMKCLFLISLLCIISLSSFSQENSQFIDETYNQNKIREITEFLASDELEGRDTPSKGLDIAAEYISSLFKKNGLQSLPDMGEYFQPVKMVSSNQPDEIKVKIGEQIISSKNNVLHVSGKWTMTIADWVVIDSVNQDLTQKDLKDKMVIYFVDKDDRLNPGQIIRESRKIKGMVQEMEADGLLEVFKEDYRFWDRFQGFYERTKTSLDSKQEDGSDIPHILIRNVNGFFGSDLEKYLEDKISIEIDGWNRKEFITNNVVGMVEGKDPVLKNEYIICTAHYDHVGIGRPDKTGDSIYNGARDNAIGVMSVMMAAENISKHPVKRSVLFVLFAGEEKGLLGSKWFVDYPPVSLKEIVFCLNTDGGGYNDTTIATIMGKKRLNTLEIFKKACSENGLTAFEGTDDTQFLFSSSDNIIFSREGIPSVTFSPGFKGMDAEIMKYYHRPSDEVESMDFNYVEKYSRSFGLSLRMIADSGERLFWREGDEFYTLGQELYK